MTSARSLDWYFDYVSGFSYLQFECLHRLPADVAIRYRPVLFAGLLGHHGHKGPAEIAAKRRFTYRHWVWQAARLGIPFKMPPAHPFNPLAALRLTLALDCAPEVITAIFRFVWRDGRSVETPEGWQDLAGELGIADAEALAGDAGAKGELRRRTEAAAALGVFGVPTVVVDGELFWGLDATDMVLDYLDAPERFRSGELARVSELPIGTARRL